MGGAGVRNFLDLREKVFFLSTMPDLRENLFFLSTMSDVYTQKCPNIKYGHNHMFLTSQRCWKIVGATNNEGIKQKKEESGAYPSSLANLHSRQSRFFVP